jgi:small-conductance mechanosensitive channel
MLFTATASFAETHWEQHHPRRDQVNERLENQSRRIRDGREDDLMSRSQARQLRVEDRNIRDQARLYSRLDGGHISKAEQGVLNQEENRVSHQIYNDEH